MSKLISAVPTFLVADVGATISWYEMNLVSPRIRSLQSLLMLLPVSAAMESK